MIAVDSLRADRVDERVMPRLTQLAARGARFERGRLEQRFQVYRGKEPLLIERTCVSGGTGALEAPWALRNNPVLAALYVFVLNDFGLTYAERHRPPLE